MRFKEGDKVEFIYRNKKSVGEINGVFPETQILAIKQSDSPVDLLFSDKAVAKVEEPELVVVPQCVADWIEQKKANGDQLYIAMDKSWESMNYTVSDWLEEGEDRYNKFARAWLDGYEVEKEPLYYVQLIQGICGYLNVRNDGIQFLNSRGQTAELKTRFTEKEIKAMDKGGAYWQFAVPVKEVEA
ncbi:DUF1642 domain-containing protein [Listeria monocytogenes]|uniref:DUF1642 domain-containing protein n=1 Tax=Listeria monocytogenes TaxID=1639 RepID=UPI0010BA37FE|nr:DUF1642 domain-containing protein [Listeria monocytogenes]EAC3659901.1 DUF1642 domain-containing protein [Listeria monocytogenes]EAE2181832.1 DUF1642 domain-containing protein [Listeria monocytogenes]EAE2240718.1 DUF1642 domain-containing protein [Listeria monocytogenes]EAE3624564.1 DUF1642 domain-containing protein [Listeria monocytogenes]EAE3627844.1 DUF1642 domain-containing protein [Listeria monocytogenes]